MKVMKLEELEGHDVYEFSYCLRHEAHWNPDSVYVSYEDMQGLVSYIERVMSDFPYYSSEEVTVEQWTEMETSALQDGKFSEFFRRIREWKSGDPEGRDSFWIHGV